MQTETSVAPATSLGIREFSRQSGYSEAKVRRAMRELSIKGQFQGRGKATLLNPSEQERLALHIDEVELQGNEQAAPAPAPPPKASTTAKPVRTKPTVKLNKAVADAMEAEADAIAPPIPKATQPAPAPPKEDNTAALDQLWEARQAIHKSEAALPKIVTPPTVTQAQNPRVTTPQVQNPSPPPQTPTAMTHSPQAAPQSNSPQSNSPQNPESQSQLSAPVSPQASPAYYDPYFDAHPAIAPTTQIQPGNHRQTLAPPNLPESYDLGQFRSEETITTLADPGTIAAQAMGAINALVNGMDADIQQQRIHLEETQRAAHTLRLKAKQLQDKKIEYMIQSSTLGQAQQQSTLELQEALEGIQTLGKSPSDEPMSPSSSPSSPSPSA